MTQLWYRDIIHANQLIIQLSWESGRAKPNQKTSQLFLLFSVSPDTYFESEYDIVNQYLQLSPQLNQHKKPTPYVEDLLQSQEQNMHET